MTKGFAIAVIMTAGAMMAAAQTPQAPPPPAQAPQPAPPAGGRQGAPPPGRGGGGMLAGAGPSDKPVVDAAAADRGRKVYAAECIDCHGTQARGGDKGPNLTRSILVLRDRYGSQLGPFFKKGHTLQSGTASASLTDAQVQDLAHFLRQKVNDGLRGSPLFQVQNILTGDAKAGETFFNGEGKCATCHATNLAGIGGRLEPVDIQQRFLFPATGRGGRGRGGPPAPSPNAVRVTVTPEGGGAAISGVLVQMDDFYVTVRNADGTAQTIRRTAGTKIEKTDPLAFHVELLDKLTDKNIHDVVAYLEKLK